jgi:hypothetical protein
MTYGQFSGGDFRSRFHCGSSDQLLTITPRLLFLSTHRASFALYQISNHSDFPVDVVDSVLDGSLRPAHRHMKSLDRKRLSLEPISLIGE